MNKEKLKQFFELAEELYMDKAIERGLKNPPIHVDVENEDEIFVVISGLEYYSKIIKKHLKEVDKEIRTGIKEIE